MSNFECALCRRDVSLNFIQCIMCGNIKYCSRPCQIDHWSIHKSECKRENMLLINGNQFAINLHTAKLRINDQIENKNFHIPKQPTPKHTEVRLESKTSEDSGRQRRSSSFSSGPTTKQLFVADMNFNNAVNHRESVLSSELKEPARVQVVVSPRAMESLPHKATSTKASSLTSFVTAPPKHNHVFIASLDEPRISHFSPPLPPKEESALDLPMKQPMPRLPSSVLPLDSSNRKQQRSSSFTSDPITRQLFVADMSANDVHQRKAVVLTELKAKTPVPFTRKADPPPKPSSTEPLLTASPLEHRHVFIATLEEPRAAYLSPPALYLKSRVQEELKNDQPLNRLRPTATRQPFINTANREATTHTTNGSSSSARQDKSKVFIANF